MLSMLIDLGEVLVDSVSVGDSELSPWDPQERDQLEDIQKRTQQFVQETADAFSASRTASPLDLAATLHQLAVTGNREQRNAFADADADAAELRDRDRRLREAVQAFTVLLSRLERNGDEPTLQRAAEQFRGREKLWHLFDDAQERTFYELIEAARGRMGTAVPGTEGTGSRPSEPLIGYGDSPTKGPDPRGGETADRYEPLMARMIREGIEQTRSHAEVAHALAQLAAPAAMTGEILARLVTHFPGPVEAAYLQEVIRAWKAEQQFQMVIPEWFSRPGATYYEILGVDPSASPDQIKRAYRLQAIRWHPDRHPEAVELTDRITRKITEAYATLSDPTKRANNDAGAAGRAGASDLVNVSAMYSRKDVEYLKRQWAEVMSRKKREMLDRLASAGFGLDHIGARRVHTLHWGKDGTLYIGWDVPLSHDPLAGIDVFNPFTHPGGIKKWGKGIRLGSYGRVFHIVESPVDDRVALITTPGSETPGRRHPTIVMVFRWNQLMRHMEKYERHVDRSYRVGELLSRRVAFQQEGLIDLPGCDACLVLPDAEVPSLTWSLDGQRLLITI